MRRRVRVLRRVFLATVLLCAFLGGTVYVLSRLVRYLRRPPVRQSESASSGVDKERGSTAASKLEWEVLESTVAGTSAGGSARSVPGYTVKTTAYTLIPDGYRETRVAILDPDGKVCVDLEGGPYGGNGTHAVIDLTGDGYSDAVLSTYSGGAHCCTTYYLYSFHPRLQLLACVSAGNGTIRDIKDLDHDGKMEVLLTDDAFSYYDNLAYDCSPGLPMVLGYRRGRYVDVTLDFPDIVKADIRQAKAEVVDILDRNRAVKEAWQLPRDPLDGAILRWFADAVVLGEEEEQLRIIRKTAPKERVAWLEANRAEITEFVGRRESRLSYELPEN